MIIEHPLNGTRDDFGWRYLDTSVDLTCPWYTLGCLQWLDSIDLSELSVFEYGCGLSSIWWQKKSKFWNGVDSNPKWANGGMVPLNSNGEIDQEKYTKSCLGKNYDIIVIDGIYRDECTQHALLSIRENGFIIIDNWEQNTTGMDGDFWNNTKLILKEYHLDVYKEPKHVDWKTAVFHIKKGI